MRHFRVQAGDFQDSGLEGNIAKIGLVVDEANRLAATGERVSLDLVGDIFDTHLFGTADAQTLFRDALTQNPELEEAVREHAPAMQKHQALIGEYEAFERELAERLGGDTELSAQDQEQLAGWRDRLKESLKTVEGSKNPIFLGVLKTFYERVNREHLERSEVPMFGVHGNNDLNELWRYLPGVTFADRVRSLTRDNGLTLLGSNNTNYDPYEIALPRELIPECDAYEDWSKVEGRPDVVIMHGPPNGIGFRQVRGKSADSGSEANSLSELIRERKPQLVECGHFHSGKLEEIDGVVYARTSDTCAMVHEFDEDNRYVGTDVYLFE